MSRALSRALESIRRRISLQIGKFLLAAVNDSGTDSLGRVTVQRIDGTVFAGERELKDRAHYQTYGLTAHPIPGNCEGIALCPQGSRSQLIVIALDSPVDRPTGLVEGEVALYTDEEPKGVKLARGRITEMRGVELDASYSDTAAIATSSGQVSVGSVSGPAILLSWINTTTVRSITADVQILAATIANITAPSITLNGAVTITGSLIINGKNVSDTHTHTGSPTAPVGAVSNTGQVV
jgi:phage gp45-like